MNFPWIVAYPGGKSQIPPLNDQKCRYLGPFTSFHPSHFSISILTSYSEHSITAFFSIIFKHNTISTSPLHLLANINTGHFVHQQGYFYQWILCIVCLCCYSEWESKLPKQGCHGTGKTGIWKSIFPDRENTGNLLKNIKNMFLHREFTTNTGKIWVFKKKKKNL